MLAVTGCRREAEEAELEREEVAPLRVMTTNLLVAELARRVAGDAAEVGCLLEPGGGAGMLRRSGPVEAAVLTSDLVVRLGLGTEEALERTFERAAESGVRVCELGPAFPPERLHPHPKAEGRPDPQVWMNPVLWAAAIDPLVAALSEAQPERAAEIETRGNVARFELQRLQEATEETIRFIPEAGRQIITGNSGLRYLGDAAGVAVRLGEPRVVTTTERELEGLRLDTLQPAGTLAVAHTASRDLGTYPGLVQYAADLLYVVLL